MLLQLANTRPSVLCCVVECIAVHTHRDTGSVEDCGREEENYQSSFIINISHNQIVDIIETILEQEGMKQVSPSHISLVSYTVCPFY